MCVGDGDGLSAYLVDRIVKINKYDAIRIMWTLGAPSDMQLRVQNLGYILGTPCFISGSSTLTSIGGSLSASLSIPCRV